MVGEFSVIFFSTIVENKTDNLPMNELGIESNSHLIDSSLQPIKMIY